MIQPVLAALLAFYGSFLSVGVPCLALHASAYGRELGAVPGSFGVCLDVGAAAAREGVPVEVAIAVAYRETRFRGGLVGGGGEIGVLQVKSRWWPEARRHPLRTGLRALKTCHAFGRQDALRKCRGRPACRRRILGTSGWRRAVAHYHGGIAPSWGYAERVWVVVEAAGQSGGRNPRSRE